MKNEAGGKFGYTTTMRAVLGREPPPWEELPLKLKMLWSEDPSPEGEYPGTCTMDYLQQLQDLT